MDIINTTNIQLCRICISSNVNCTQMISIFGEDSLWRKITTLADVKVEPGDTLPQHVCVTCAKNTISACLFKKKCEDADNFFRQQLLIRKIESKSDTQDNVESEDEQIPRNGQTHRSDEDMSEHSQQHNRQRQINGDHRPNDEQQHIDNLAGEQNEEDADDDDDDDQQHANINGEVKVESDSQKHPAFDFNSIRLMHEYMQQHLSKFNGLQAHHGHGAVSDDEGAGGDNAGSGTDSEQDDDDDDPLPLIPEIELITPSEEGSATGVLGADGTIVGVAGMTQTRGYQCPHCFQIFEMKQLLKAHMQSVHGTAGPVYECTNCKKTYFYKRFLEKHIRRGRCVKKRRNQTRPMQCTDCNVLFPTGHHLGWHKRTGCPSKTAKMPLQQLFKQNIVQYNNFPRRVGMRKPENALYLHNRKLMMANNKRKGRTRIKLDARKIALAKQLILREATTTVIANELNISRTFAWRLRKSLVNGVSLHERVIDPPEEDEDNEYDNAAEAVEGEVADATENVQKHGDILNHRPFTEHIKREIAGTEDEEDLDNNDDLENRLLQKKLELQHTEMLQNQSNAERTQVRQANSTAASVATSVIQRTRSTNSVADEQNLQLQLQQQQHHHHQQQKAIEQKLHNTISVVQQQRLMELNSSSSSLQLDSNVAATTTAATTTPINDVDDESESNEDSETNEDYHLQQQHETDMNKCGVNSQQQKFLQNNCLKNTNLLGSNGKVPLLNHLSPAVAAAINQLPVNLSIRPIASMQNNDIAPNDDPNKKKPRKPNVFIDDEKYAMAKMLVSQNASTMEIAKALNVSQMTAWKVRDAIIKGVPLSYRNRRDIRMTMIRTDEDATGVLSEGSEGSRRDTENERQQQALLVEQQLEHQHKLQQQHLKQQQQIQQLLQRQQQLQQQQQQLEQQKQQRQQQQQREEQQQLQQQQQQLLQQKQKQQQQATKPSNPRRRLKAAEREVRDKEITREILELIKEDSNIQYWKVSARLAEKGYAISPSSVCQKLKSMGIHRRWKPGDKPPLIDMEHLKASSSTSAEAAAAANNTISVATLAAAAAAVNAQNASSSADESYEQQFDMGGAHFLSAFTR